MRKMLLSLAALLLAGLAQAQALSLKVPEAVPRNRSCPVPMHPSPSWKN